MNISVVFILAFSILSGNYPSGDLDRMFSEFVECSNESTNRCEEYTYKVLSEVYKKPELNQISTNTSFYAVVREGKTWKFAGHAYDQNVLSNAQELANKGVPVVAIFTNSTNQAMHVAAILPGELSSSGSWGMNVPNAASFPDFNPDHAFVNKPLSYAFEKKALLSIGIYVLNQ